MGGNFHHYIMEQLKLADIAEISLGRPFKKKVEKSATVGNTYLVQISELNSGYLNRIDKLEKITLDSLDERHHLKSNDILMPLRGGKVVADLLSYESSTPIITNNQVAIIKVTSNACDPKYLQWFLNSKYTKRYIEATSQGSLISSIRKQTVECIPITIPPRSIQNQIALVNENWNMQKRIHHEMIVSGDLAFEALCNKLIEEKVR